MRKFLVEESDQFLKDVEEAAVEAEEFDGIRKFPIYESRYSAKWVVDLVHRRVVLIALLDSKYPKTLRQFQTD